MLKPRSNLNLGRTSYLLPLVLFLAAVGLGFCLSLYKDQVSINKQLSERVARLEEDVIYKGQKERTNDHSTGAVNPKLTLIVYSDFECPYCKKYHPTLRTVTSHYKDKIKLIFRQMPLSFHENAELEAKASECVAQKAGNPAFWSFTDKVFEKTTSGGTGISKDDLYELTAGFGLDRSTLDKCLTEPAISQKISRDTASAEKIGINGTPATVFIRPDGTPTLISGVLTEEELSNEIDKALK